MKTLATKNQLGENQSSADFVIEYLNENPEVIAEIITATLAMFLLVSASKDFSRNKGDLANKKIFGGSFMLTASAFLAGNLQYALPDLGIFISSNVATLAQKYPQITNAITKKFPEKIKQNLHIAAPTIFAAAIFIGLILFGIINSTSSAIVPAGLGILAINYSLKNEADKILKRTLAIVGGSLIVIGGTNDLFNALAPNLNLKGAILSAVYTILNIYFTAAEIQNLRNDKNSDKEKIS